MALQAPVNRARIRPSRLFVRSNRTFSIGLISSSSFFCKCTIKKTMKIILYVNPTYQQHKPLSEKSSTRITSFNKCAGERSSTDQTVRNNAEYASL